MQSQRPIVPSRRRDLLRAQEMSRASAMAEAHVHPYDSPPAFAAESWAHDFRAVVWQLQQLQCRLEDGLRPWDPERSGVSSASKVASLAAENERLRAELQQLKLLTAIEATNAWQNTEDNVAPTKQAMMDTNAPPALELQMSNGQMHEFKSTEIAEIDTKVTIQQQKWSSSAQSSQERWMSEPEAMDFHHRNLSRTSSAMSAQTVHTTSGEAPHRAIVVNARRLVQAYKVLEIMHQLIKDTAVAALTLAAGGTIQQFRTTCFFIVSVVIIYTMHDRRWDRLDVADVATLLPLLSDDVDAHAGCGMYNPNRILKGMSYTGSNRLFWLKVAVHILAFGISACAWMILTFHWGLWLGDTTFIEDWATTCIGDDDDDGNVLGMQVVVGTIMFLLHLAFEFANYYEMCSVMPRTANHGVWDPREHGIPLKYKLLGCQACGSQATRLCMI